MVAVVARPDQVGNQVIAQIIPFAVDELAEVGAHLLDRPGDPAARAAAVADHHAGPVAEVVLVLTRYAEHLADGVDGEREGELVDEVRLTLPAGPRLLDDLVDQMVGERLDPRGELGDAARGERLGHQPAQPGVVRRVDVEQMRHQLRLALPRDPGLALGVRGLRVVRRILAEPLVGEGLAGVGVAGDQPGLDPAGELGAVHRGVLAQPCVGRVRVGRELPVEEGRALGGRGVGRGCGGLLMHLKTVSRRRAVIPYDCFVAAVRRSAIP